MKKRFAEKGNKLKEMIPGLEAVFCIGSSANSNDFKNEGYQDFDVHFFANKSFLDKSELDAIKNTFAEIAEGLEAEDTAIGYCIKDKPWKMMPRKKINVGFHGTLLNSLDYKKRIGPNHILAMNMFGHSEILSGKLGYPSRQPADKDFLEQAGGIGWLKENFYRLVNVLDPNSEEMAAPIKEVAIYFGLSPLIHYYYLRNGKTANRADSRTFFLSDKSVPKSIREAADYIYEVKNRAGAGRQADNLPLLEAAYSILYYVGDEFKKSCGPDAPRYRKTEEDEDSSLISAMLGREIAVRRVKTFFSASTYSEAAAAVKEISRSFSNVTPDEYFETLNFLIRNPAVSETNRVYFFEEGDSRAGHAVDFTEPDAAGLIYSWEKGIATYLQRLNELYLNSPCLTEDDVTLAKLLAAVSLNNYGRLKNKAYSAGDLKAKLGLGGSLSREERYFRYLECLAVLGDHAARKIEY